MDSGQKADEKSSPERTARGTLSSGVLKRVPAFFYRTPVGNEPVRQMAQGNECGRPALDR